MATVPGVAADATIATGRGAGRVGPARASPERAADPSPAGPGAGPGQDLDPTVACPGRPTEASGRAKRPAPTVPPARRLTVPVAARAAEIGLPAPPATGPPVTGPAATGRVTGPPATGPVGAVTAPVRAEAPAQGERLPAAAVPAVIVPTVRVADRWARRRRLARRPNGFRPVGSTAMR